MSLMQQCQKGIISRTQTRGGIRPVHAQQKKKTFASFRQPIRLIAGANRGNDFQIIKQCMT